MLPWRCCHCCRCGAGIIAALASLQTSPWRSCGPPSRALMPASWSLAFLPSSQRDRRPSGPVPLYRPFFRVDLFDCLGFGSRPDGRAARLLGQRRLSLGLRLLGRPLGMLDTQQGRLLVIIRNVARSFLLPVIPVPSGLVLLLGRHHPGKSNAGAGICLRHPRRSLRRGRRPPLGLQCPIAEGTMNGKESCASAQY
jgi:hypothetical protein